MAAWLRERVPVSLPSDARFERLLDAIQGPGGLELTYDPEATLSAAEVFATRRFNCLAFAHLLVALGREVGLDLYYLEASGVERYRRDGDLVVLSAHVTVGWDEGPHRRVVEMVYGPRFDPYSGRKVSDQHALALHHVNLGAFLLRDGELAGALSHLVTAARLAPGRATPWLDLGVALRRRGQLDAAEAAYRRAIAVEPEATGPYDNLYALLRMRGRDDAASELLEVLERGGKRNPWLLLSLGDTSLAAGDRAGALRFYRRARNTAPQEAAPAAALAAWHLAQGDERRARRWWRRAMECDPTEPRLEPVARRLGETLPPPPTTSAMVPAGG
jgi:Flp pilus assembly protein TadD